jgi:hypothetical protein
MAMVDDNRRFFRQILDAFLGLYKFYLPGILERPTTKAARAPAP